MIRAGHFLVLIFLAGCCSPQEASLADSPVGEVVKIHGRAVNAKLSAAVRSDALLVYCIEISEWPGEVEGRQVTVSGRLEKTDQFRATTGPSGDRSAGTAGGDYVLRSVTWQVD